MARGQAGARGCLAFIIKLVVLAVLGAGLILGIGFWQYKENLKPVDLEGSGKEITISISSGASTVKIAQMLEREGLIRDDLTFRAYSRLKGFDGKLKAGEFTLSTSMGVPEIMDKIAEGAVDYISFTIPEGFNTKQIVDTLVEKELVDRDTFMDLVAKGDFDYDFIKDLPKGEKRLEGYLFPDTYKISHRTTEKEIIDMMLARFAKVATPEYIRLAQQQGLTLHQAVTLASVIEREAKVDLERPKVAAVFLNRMRKGWKLESCATVQYALGQQKARLLNEDLQIDSPYNTYKIAGLPPGPIASPGEMSLKAAVNPADVDYLFFVVFEDGKHVFSKTISEHNIARDRYIKESFGN